MSTGIQRSNRLGSVLQSLNGRDIRLWSPNYCDRDCRNVVSYQIAQLSPYPLISHRSRKATPAFLIGNIQAEDFDMQLVFRPKLGVKSRFFLTSPRIRIMKSCKMGKLEAIRSESVQRSALTYWMYSIISFVSPQLR